ncbi:hypothetical protein K431DRAFT_38130 [Polychaeton citri CBS 116435]|uniref:Uncharacterized protein n=1 Tax=Polychaeton citri CBS 116435 TaxID=1314669 RepID=A0A9P4PY28_9PEZI|nr:hypothetical protein K431DRAFT_38130 [Polychaeton citri CBS 116435]
MHQQSNPKTLGRNEGSCLSSLSCLLDPIHPDQSINRTYRWQTNGRSHDCAPRVVRNDHAHPTSPPPSLSYPPPAPPAPPP